MFLFIQNKPNKADATRFVAVMQRRQFSYKIRSSQCIERHKRLYFN